MHREIRFDERKLAFQEAILRGDCRTVMSLVAEGANLNHREATQGFTPLHWAAHIQNKDIVAILMNYGADPNMTNFVGETPLELAQAQQDPPASQELFDLLDPPHREDELPPKAAVRP